MAQKKYPPPNKKQAALIKYRGYDPRYYVVMKELNFSLFIKDIRDGTVKIIDKSR